MHVILRQILSFGGGVLFERLFVCLPPAGGRGRFLGLTSCKVQPCCQLQAMHPGRHAGRTRL